MPGEETQLDADISHRTAETLSADLARTDLLLYRMDSFVLRSSMDKIPACAQATIRSAGKALSTTG
jgi:hypothetical protein